MKSRSAFETLMSKLSTRDFRADVIIGVDVLPYPAKFIADPFICFSGDRYHILCEVFVKNGDKRISHLVSEDGKSWSFCADVIIGESVSFPAFYHSGVDAGELVVVPQLGGASSFSLKAYSYNLANPGLAIELYSIALQTRMKDRLLVTDPNNKKFIIYGHNFKYRSTLSASLAPGNLESGVTMGKEGDHFTVSRRTLVELLKNKLFRKPKLTHRPAGNILESNGTSFVIPIQATIDGLYGECLAFLRVEWEGFRVLSIEYLYPQEIDQNFCRTHHISWTVNREEEIVFCGDFIDNEQGDWKLYVSVPQKKEYLCQ